MSDASLEFNSDIERDYNFHSYQGSASECQSPVAGSCGLVMVISLLRRPQAKMMISGPVVKMEDEGTPAEQDNSGIGNVIEESKNNNQSQHAFQKKRVNITKNTQARGKIKGE